MGQKYQGPNPTEPKVEGHNMGLEIQRPAPMRSGLGAGFPHQIRFDLRKYASDQAFTHTTNIDESRLLSLARSALLDKEAKAAAADADERGERDRRRRRRRGRGRWQRRGRTRRPRDAARRPPTTGRSSSPAGSSRRAPARVRMPSPIVSTSSFPLRGCGLLGV